MKDHIPETNKWADIYLDHGCPFDLAYMEKIPGKSYWRQDEDKGHIHLDNAYTLLAEILGFTGTNNFDDEDCFEVLSLLYKGLDNYAGSNTLEKITNEFVRGMNPCMDYISDGLKKKIHLQTEKYINTLLCLLYDKGLVCYGTYLQGCWITKKGRWIVLNRDLCINRIKKIQHERCDLG